MFGEQYPTFEEGEDGLPHPRSQEPLRSPDFSIIGSSERRRNVFSPPFECTGSLGWRAAHGHGPSTETREYPDEYRPDISLDTSLEKAS